MREQAAQCLRLEDLLDPNVDQDLITVGLHPHGAMQHGFACGGLLHRGGEVELQAFPRHVEHVDDVLRTRSGLEEVAGAPVDVDDVAALVDDDRRRCHVFEQHPFDRLLDAHLTARTGRSTVLNAVAQIDG